MTEGALHLATKMEALKRRYLLGLEPRIETLKAFVKTCERGAPDMDLAVSVSGVAHKLSGSGATYGYAAISEAAQVLEDLLGTKPLPPHTVLQVKAQALLESCLAAHGAQPLAPEATPAAADADAGEDKGGLPVVILADDDEAIQQMVAAALHDEAHVVQARNGHEALDALKRLIPSLILLDDQMPQLGGFDVLDALKQQEGDDRRLPVMMLTANRKNTDVIMAYRFGVVDYIAKPFDPASLRARVLDFIARHRKTILIADDDPVILNLLNVKLSTLGFRVVQARDVGQAKDLIAKEKPDLCLLDRMLPGGDSLDLLMAMRKAPETKALPVVFLTAKRRESDILEALKNGAQDYIVKPFKIDEVLARCGRFLKVEEREQN